MIRTCFNTSNSSTITLFTTILFCKVLITLQIKLMVKEVIVEELEAFNQILSVKE